MEDKSWTRETSNENEDNVNTNFGKIHKFEKQFSIDIKTEIYLNNIFSKSFNSIIIYNFLFITNIQ